MLRQIRALNGAVVKGREALVSAANDLGGSVDALEGRLGADVSTSARRSILDQLLVRAVRGDYRDYIAAEQAAMAMDLLLISIGAWEVNKPAIDAVFTSVEDDEAYRPARFVAAAQALKGAL
jgi:hypothetical protein